MNDNKEEWELEFADYDFKENAKFPETFFPEDNITYRAKLLTRPILVPETKHGRAFKVIILIDNIKYTLWCSRSFMWWFTKGVQENNFKNEDIINKEIKFKQTLKEVKGKLLPIMKVEFL